jgi:aryl-alcohol dehydrogenase-like predicted oxidoreductase
VSRNLCSAPGRSARAGGHGAEPDEAGRIFNAYADAGGNFIDTANGYQFGQSEEILGDLLTGRRDDFVLATKFTFGTDPKAGIFVTGNSRKSMVASVEASLKRLKTDRIDLYWAHVSDGVTPLEEIVRGFDNLVRAGKILYAGLSDFPAWRVARAATIAELRGLAPIAGLQVEHSLVERTTEQELLPAGQALGLGIVAWSPLGGGMLTGKYRQGEKGRREGFGGRVFQDEDSSHRTAILDTLIGVAKDAGVTPAEIAIAWVAAKGSLPIIGPRTLAQLENNLAAAKVNLSPEQIARLDDASAIPAVFPFRMINNPETQQGFTGGKVEQFDAPAEPVA